MATNGADDVVVDVNGHRHAGLHLRRPPTAGRCRPAAVHRPEGGLRRRAPRALAVRSPAAVLDQFDTLGKAGARVVMVTHGAAAAPA